MAVLYIQNNDFIVIGAACSIVGGFMVSIGIIYGAIHHSIFG